MSRGALTPVALFVVLALAACANAADEAGVEYFEKHVRPILAARCYECHSARSVKLQGGLRLDSRAAALKGGDTGPAVVPGKPKESLLVDAVNHGELYQMPPKTKLPADEIAVLTKWVEIGAPWPAETAIAVADPSKAFDLAQRKAEHWCWQPIQRPVVPLLKSHQTANPIDAFIRAKLVERGLSPAPPADRRTLLRRASFDLIGLPPTPAELEAFLADDSPQAFEKVVARLLDSPHFGERWARHWLDLVRYAESRGHEFDYNIPNAFEYRDYVIRALNADVPYDQFLIEHVAGDLIKEPRLHPTERYNESILGTGFWFLGEWCHSPVDIRKDECDRQDNMLDVFSKTFLGLTVACARCHDHKFDAISQQDYYALAGYLQSSSYRLTRFGAWDRDRTIAAELAALDAKHRPLIAAATAKAIEPQLDALAKRFAEGEEWKSEIGVWEVDLKGAQTIVDYSQPLAGAWMTDGPTWGSGPVNAGEIVLIGEPAQPLEVAAYGSARRDWAWGDLGIVATNEGDAGRLAGWVRAGRALKTPTFTITAGPVHYLIEGAGYVYAAVDSHAMINGPLHGELQKDTGGNSDLPIRWITHDLSRYVGHRCHLEFSPKEGEDFRVLMVVQGSQRPAAPESRAYRLSDAIAADPRLELAAALELLAADKIAKDKQPRDRAALVNWLIAQAKLDEQQPPDLVAALDAYRAAQERITDRIQTESRLCLAMWDGTPQSERLLIRGNHKTPGPEVPPRLLEALQGSGVRGQESSGRLDMARRLVDPANPLVSRVIVNRVWHHLFGRGIVPSVDNFGVLGQKPTHPELLDYLATQFMQDGWSLKRLIRSIVLSETYQQGSGVRGQDSVADPENLLFHRQNLRRLEGEAIRDAILDVSGQLDRKMYGSSVPVYLTPFMQGRGRPRESGPLDGAGRRSIYVAVRRNFLSPMMLAFDTPIPFTTIGRRNISNVPAQALILMNDPFVAEQANHWAKRVLADKNATDESRIRQMYLSAYSREPTVAETAAAIEFLGAQAREYRLAADMVRNDSRVWVDLGHVLYNVKEFAFIN